MNHLELKHLRLIRTIAETGNMTKAAATLCLSQPALSQQLKDIEGKLGVDLFFRTRKRMLLTPIGKRLHKTAGQVIDAVENAELDIARIVNGDRGELKVGTECLYCYKWLPRVMRIFQETFPNIAFEIGSSLNLTQELADKTYDMVITAAPPTEDCACVDLFEDRMVCIMPCDHPLSTQDHVRYTDFGAHRMIAHIEKERYRLYQLILKPRGIEPQGFMAVGQPQAVVDMVASGFGISVLPHWAVARSLASDRLVALPITAGGFPLVYRIAFLSKRRIPVFQKEFIRIIKREDITGRSLPGQAAWERMAGY